MLKGKNWCTSLIVILFLSLVMAEGGFNLEIKLSEDSREIPAGEDLWFTFKVMNLESQGRIDVTLEYKILGVDDEVLTSKTETVAIETQASFVGELMIPSDAQEGNYKLVAVVKTLEGEYEAEAPLIIIGEEKERDLKGMILVVSIIVGIVGVIIFLVLIRRVFKKARIRLRIRGIVRRKANVN